MKLSRTIFIFTIMLALALFVNGLHVLSVWRTPPGPGMGEDRPGTELAQQGTKPFRLEEIPAGDQPVNLLVLGLDEEEVRTDVILLFNYSPVNTKLNILSIARDTRVYYRGRHMKVNALYSSGGERLLAARVEDMTGLPVHYYLTLDFKGFRKIIDTLGGVRFKVPFYMDYDDPEQSLHIHLAKGTQLLNGKKAEQLVRYRKGNSPDEGYIDGDIGRIRMQQEFLKALLSQKLNLRYASSADDIFRILEQYVKTNIRLSDLTRYLGSMVKLKPEGVNCYTLPGDSDMIGDVWYYIMDAGQTEKLIEDKFYMPHK